MARRLRHFKPGVPFEITIRTVDGRFSLAPKEDLVKEQIGALKRAGRMTGVRVLYAVGLSNHLHLIIIGDDANQVGRWASLAFAQMARASQFHHGLTGRIWGRRFRAIPILSVAALRARIKYLMAQPCCATADLVEKPRQWVGLNAIQAVCDGVPLEGFYLTARQRRAAVRAGKSVGAMYGNSRAHREVLEFAPVPWIDPAPHAQRAWFRQLEREVIEEAQVRRSAGKRFPHPSVYRRQNPHQTPKNFERSPAPDCHAANSEERQGFRKTWQQFVAQWREAMARFKQGLSVCFPPGGWRPFNCAASLPVQLE